MIIKGVFKMFAILISMSVFGFVMTDKGNDNPSWEFIGFQPCVSGEKSSGFAYSIGDQIFLKQKNLDGSIGPICEN